jgi:hypothetical protein
MGLHGPAVQTNPIGRNPSCETNPIWPGLRKSPASERCETNPISGRRNGGWRGNGRRGCTNKANVRQAGRGCYRPSWCSGALRPTNPVFVRATRRASALWKRSYGKSYAQSAWARPGLVTAVWRGEPPPGGLQAGHRRHDLRNLPRMAKSRWPETSPSHLLQGLSCCVRDRRVTVFRGECRRSGSCPRHPPSEHCGLPRRDRSS